jgi:hypothetical protein
MCVAVALGIQPAMHARHIIRGLCRSTYISTLSHKQQDFWEKSY